MKKRRQTSFLVLIQAGVAVRRDHDRRDIEAIPYQALFELEAAHGGHLKIQDHAGGKPLGQGSEKLLPRFIGKNVEGARPQQPAQGLEHGRIIINNGYPGGSIRHGRL